jgi:hypothetical protein
MRPIYKCFWQRHSAGLRGFPAGPRWLPAPRCVAAFLKREAFAALGTPAVDHRPPSFGGHALAKTTASDTFNFARLVRSFHVSVPSSIYGNGIGSAPLILEKFRSFIFTRAIFKPQLYLQAPKLVNT